MADGWAVDTATLSAHAAAVATLRLRVDQVAAESAGLRWDDTSFGSLAGWIAEALERVTLRQIELIEYVAENFALISQSLWETVESRRDTEPVSRWAVGLPGPARSEGGGTIVIRGPRTLHEPGTRFVELLDEILDGAWVDPRLGPGLPAPRLVAAVEPAAPRPLRGILHGLTGTPDVVASQAETLESGAAELHRAGADLYRILQPVLRWPGHEVDEYLTLMNHNIDALGQLVGTSMAIASCARAADLLVGHVHDLVNELAAGAGPDFAAVELGHRRALEHVSALVASLTALARLVD
ncbi:hypothetical protein [Cryptosporangium arvum]|uniref:hypothetical protein n=1 Tax=Cryptosporangium arvum TaxID=80871 RepID=UPI0004B9DC6F|nr:hypothetical protein [Cryptosporangium arvum]